MPVVHDQGEPLFFSSKKKKKKVDLAGSPVARFRSKPMWDLGTPRNAKRSPGVETCLPEILGRGSLQDVWRNPLVLSRTAGRTDILVPISHRVLKVADG